VTRSVGPPRRDAYTPEKHTHAHVHDCGTKH